MDVFMLRLLRSGRPHNTPIFWGAVIASTAGQAICNSLQFNGLMTFFASRVDPAIGGSYMTLLNTMANLGGTWPASFVMKLLGWMTPDASSSSSESTAASGLLSWFGGDPYECVQTVFSVLGILWVLFLGPVVRGLAALPDNAWRTRLLDDDNNGRAIRGGSAAGAASTKSTKSSKATKPRKRSNAKNRNNPSVVGDDMESGVDVGRWNQAKNDGKIE
mmetsp:Transcript_23630/g.50252  ORF Transcript_23630/g.50252 Transcript_23630/m.50252 type:complete len:218 (+) Transcript_23630:335-988(+)